MKANGLPLSKFSHLWMQQFKNSRCVVDRIIFTRIMVPGRCNIFIYPLLVAVLKPRPLSISILAMI